MDIISLPSVLPYLHGQIPLQQEEDQGGGGGCVSDPLGLPPLQSRLPPLPRLLLPGPHLVGGDDHRLHLPLDQRISSENRDQGSVFELLCGGHAFKCYQHAFLHPDQGHL